MSKSYEKSLKLQPVECDCEKCQSMCTNPCNGPPSDFEKLIKAGYADRLSMVNNYDSEYPPAALQPALKGYESKEQGNHWDGKNSCTFFKDGKCELHNLGLKPIQGKLWIHEGISDDTTYKFISKMEKSWSTKKAKKLIERWKKAVNFEETDD